MKFECKKIEEEQILEENEFQYLYSTLFKFSYLANLEIFDSDQTIIQGTNLTILYNQVREAFEELLKNFYVEPNLKKRAKYPGRYEKVIFEDRKYVVDYTMSRLGRLIYTLNIRLLFIKKIIDNNLELIIMPLM